MSLEGNELSNEAQEPLVKVLDDNEPPVNYRLSPKHLEEEALAPEPDFDLGFDSDLDFGFELGPDPNFDLNAEQLRFLLQTP